jgi:lysine biosynthesis protein LysW
MPVAICPECEAKIDFSNPVQIQIGERMVCPECDNMELEVISVKPLALDYALDDKDWEDEDWEDWDDE